MPMCTTPGRQAQVIGSSAFVSDNGDIEMVDIAHCAVALYVRSTPRSRAFAPRSMTRRATARGCTCDPLADP